MGLFFSNLVNLRTSRTLETRADESVSKLAITGPRRTSLPFPESEAGGKISSSKGLCSCDLSMLKLSLSVASCMGKKAILFFKHRAFSSNLSFCSHSLLRRLLGRDFEATLTKWWWFFDGEEGSLPAAAGETFSVSSWKQEQEEDAAENQSPGIHGVSFRRRSPEQWHSVRRGGGNKY